MALTSSSVPLSFLSSLSLFLFYVFLSVLSVFAFLFFLSSFVSFSLGFAHSLCNFLSSAFRVSDFQG